MATLDLQEQEQIEALKHFWKNYGSAIAFGLVALCVGYGGVYGWKAWKAHNQTQAAEAYRPFGEAIKSEKPDLAKLAPLADTLARDYASTVYAAQAALATARQEVVAGKTAEAQKRLQWVLDHNKDEALLAVARLRLASVLIDTQKADAALKTLQAEHPAEFDSLFAESRGDALVQKKDLAAAKRAYIAAQGSADAARKMVLDWKLQALGA